MRPNRKLLYLVSATAAAALLFAGLLVSAQRSAQAAPQAVIAPNALLAEEYAAGFVAPVEIASTGVAGDGRLFVVERTGRIKVVQPGGSVQATPFLSLTQFVGSTGSEDGMFGLAFSPDYANNGHFFVYYVNLNGDLQLSRFSVSDNDENLADPTETLILTIPHTMSTSHNGGDLAFGADGYLYLAPGDGGGSGDPFNNAQSLDSLLGKILRLNVTNVPTYTVPDTNPYTATAALGEIWARGLRNPFRFSFDRLTGDLYLGDVGQSHWEEINFQPASSLGGENYGWHCYEGAHPYPPDSPNNDCDTSTPYSLPVAEFCNGRQAGCDDGGQAVIAGYVYRGAAYPGLYGYYFFADAGTARFWAMESSYPWHVTPLDINNVVSPSGFGEDVNGELYVADRVGGRVYRLVGNWFTALENPVWLPLVAR